MGLAHYTSTEALAALRTARKVLDPCTPEQQALLFHCRQHTQIYNWPSTKTLVTYVRQLLLSGAHRSSGSVAHSSMTSSSRIQPQFLASTAETGTPVRRAADPAASAPHIAWNWAGLRSCLPHCRSDTSAAAECAATTPRTAACDRGPAQRQEL